MPITTHFSVSSHLDSCCEFLTGPSVSSVIKHILQPKPTHVFILSFLPDTNTYRVPAVCRYWSRYWGYGLEQDRPVLSVLGHLCLTALGVSRDNRVRRISLRAAFRDVQDRPRLFLQPLDFYLLPTSSALVWPEPSTLSKYTWQFLHSRMPSLARFSICFTLPSSKVMALASCTVRPMWLVLPPLARSEMGWMGWKNQKRPCVFKTVQRHLEFNLFEPPEGGSGANSSFPLSSQ